MTETKQCPKCTSGTITCPRCNGNGEKGGQRCTLCDASGKRPCPYCEGKGHIPK